MDENRHAAKTLGLVKRGPLAMHATWEILPVRMLRLLVEIERAEKTRRPNDAGEMTERTPS